MKKFFLLGSILLSGLLLQAQTLPGKFHSSWIGNTYGGKNSSFGTPDPNDPNDKWIQDYIDCMTVTEDGTCYTASDWDEAHREFGIYKDGDVLGNQDMGITCGTDGGFTIVGTTITGKMVFIAKSANPMIQVHRSLFNRGIFLVTVRDDYNIQRDKLIIQ